MGHDEEVYFSPNANLALDACLQDPGLIHMQSVCRYDSSGTLLYEGDIMGFKEGDPSVYQFVFDTQNGEFKILYFGWEESSGYPSLHDQRFMDECEVHLGNIHQHPERFKEKK